MTNNKPVWIIAGTAALITIIILSTRLAVTGALVIVLGIAFGVLSGIAAGFLIVRAGLPSSSESHKPRSFDDNMTAVILPADQADKLLKILASRDQASPTDFPLVSESERKFTVVGGAQFEEDPYDEQ